MKKLIGGGRPVALRGGWKLQVRASRHQVRHAELSGCSAVTADTEQPDIMLDPAHFMRDAEACNRYLHSSQGL